MIRTPRATFRGLAASPPAIEIGIFRTVDGQRQDIRGLTTVGTPLLDLCGAANEIAVLAFVNTMLAPAATLVVFLRTHARRILGLPP